MSHTVAIIPARGGSKGIPGKNIRPFLGLPLIAHSVKAALAAETVDEVLVSSDDPAILETAEAYGASGIRRPAEIAGDEATSEAALLHAISTHPGCRTAETIVFLQCTSPLTTAGEIDVVVRERIRLSADMAFSVVETHAFLWEIAKDGSGVGVNHDASRQRQRRQDRPRQYRETGAVYVLGKDGFVAAGQRFFGRIVPIILPGSAEIELDSPADWDALEALARSTLAGS